MTNTHLLSEYNSTMERAIQLETDLQDAHADLTMLRASLRATVAIKKNGQTTEFHHQGRLVKAKLGSRGRYKIWEGKKIIDNESMDSLNQIRLNIALGRI